MRFVDKSKVGLPEVFSNKTTELERTRANEFYEALMKDPEPSTAEIEDETGADSPEAPDDAGSGPKGKKTSRTFPFKIYKDSGIKKALESLFYGKCAYCENRYASIHPVDIEHWRPKSSVMMEEQGNEARKFGYYWLAADWENLLPSCIDCNRARNHFDYVKKEEDVLGKGNWFPLQRGSLRAEKKGDETREIPLLLNPCVDRPEEYLDFLEEGIIRARTGKEEKADASIRYYALNRSELVLERLERVKLIQQRMELIERLAQLFDAIPANDTRLALMVEDLIFHEINQLRRFQESDQPFSALAGQLIGAFLKNFEIKSTRR
jgi:uncharacterized protein (TIGR02646 family)